jgi:formylglycine-generating enzyme required for sulfatase activity
METMSLVGALCGLGLRLTFGEAGEAIQDVYNNVRDRFEDHSQALPKALERANDHAWQALAVALAGDGFLDRAKRFFTGGDAKGLRERVGAFLGRHAAFFDQTPETFRRTCLAELEKARRAGLLSARGMTATEAGARLDFPYYGDPKGLMDAAVGTVERLSDDLAPSCPHLARLLRQPTPNGPSLIVSAFAFFFRREIETNAELSSGLTFESLRRLTEGQAEGFAAVGETLTELGGRFDEVMDQLGRLEVAVGQTRDAALATQDVVLDMRAELRQLGTLHLAGVEEVRRLIGEAMARARDSGPPAPALRDEGEEMTVRRLVARIRKLPEEQRRQVPALLVDEWANAGPRLPDRTIVSALGMRFVRVQPGSFLMGSPPEEPERGADEVQHAVTISRHFYLAVHPVTQAQWRAVMGDNPSRFTGDDHPVENVSWEDCRAFFKKLSQDGRSYRFPTEAEWEYACRAGTAGPFHFGSTLDADEANCDGRAGYDGKVTDVCRGETTAVGRFPANAWGLYDLHGNVYEWCADWYADYPGEHRKDPSGPASGEFRVLRGGSWFSAPRCCRSAYRYWAEPTFRDARIGCRACFSAD